MDFLSNVNLNTKLVLAIGVLLIGALAVVVLQQEPETKTIPVVSQSPVTPANPTPSKENVNKQVQQRIDHLKQVVAKNPSDARSAFELARTLQDGHNLVGALKYFEIGLKTDPKDLAARVDYSLCLYLSGKERQAFTQNIAVLKQDATNAQALYNIGAMYANTGKSDSATFYWKKVIAFHPNDDLAQKAEQNLKQLAGASSTM